jgi:drug/metabolite transporter, DME family
VATSLLLTLQPAAAVVFAAILLDEDPSALQLAGAGAILAGLLIASARPRTRDAKPALGPEQLSSPRRAPTRERTTSS